MSQRFSLLMLASCISLQADMIYGFANVQINYLDWSKRTQKEVQSQDFFYLTLEGGAGWSWGEFYGNFNIENPLHSYTKDAPDDLRFAGFGDFDIKVSHRFRLHFQNFHLHEHTYFVNDFVSGISYKYNNFKNFWIKPFIGIHHTYDAFYRGFNGYMSGWVFDYDFKIMEQKLQLTQWNEIEFGRHTRFYTDKNGTPIGDGKSWGISRRYKCMVYSYTKNYNGYPIQICSS